MESNSKLSRAKAYQIPIIIAIVLSLVLFIPAGSLRYWEAWIYWSVTLAMLIFITAYFLKKNPGLLVRRSKLKEKEPQRDIMRIISSLSMLSFLIPGFDYRFNWSDVPVWLVIASNAIVFLGFLFIFFVIKENTYASTIIQVENEQQVITTGPYAIVRHPMYVGIILTLLFTPLALGSYWALIGFLLFIPVNILRIIDEEKVLLRDLPGYKEYCLQTRYRLIPLIW